MDSNKLALLKAHISGMMQISISEIKMKYNVSSDEAQEMLDDLIQSGAVEPFSYDGAHFLVKH